MQIKLITTENNSLMQHKLLLTSSMATYMLFNLMHLSCCQILTSGVGWGRGEGEQSVFTTTKKVWGEQGSMRINSEKSNLEESGKNKKTEKTIEKRQERQTRNMNRNAYNTNNSD